MITEKTFKSYDNVVVASIDILGIKRIVNDLGDNQKAVRILTDLYENAIGLKYMYKDSNFSSEPIPSYDIQESFGDSIYLFGDPNENIETQAQRLIVRTASLVGLGFFVSKDKYALRCGIGIGNLAVKNLNLKTPGGYEDVVIRIGTSMVDAHSIEKCQNWAGCAISDKIPVTGVEQYISDYTVPKKKECSEPKIRAVNWKELARGIYSINNEPIEFSRESIIKTFESNELRHDSEREKMENTLDFWDSV